MGKERRYRWLVLGGEGILLGAATAVGVAWGLAGDPLATARVAGVGRALVTPGKSGDAWRVTIWDGGGRTVKTFDLKGATPPTKEEEQVFREATSDGASRAAIRRHADLVRAPEAPWLTFRILSFGWPARCMASERAFSARDYYFYRIVAGGREAAGLEPTHAMESWRREAAADSPFRTSGPMSAELRLLLPSPPGSPSLKEEPLVDYFQPAQTTLDPSYWTWEFRGRLLPVRPLWGGLAVCTATYAAAWLVLLWPVTGFVRRRLRRAGCCAPCGYSLAGLGAGVCCPECGRGVG